MKIIGLIQARTNSTRLPGKVEMKLNGLRLVEHIFRRLLACRELDGVAVSSHGPIAANARGLFSVNVAEDDLISRHRYSTDQLDGDAFVRITGDCLFHDPVIIDRLVRVYRDNYPYCRAVSNWHPFRTLSEGLDAELYGMDLMTELDEDKNCPREDFATYVAKNAERLKLAHFRNSIELPMPKLSIDTEEDFTRAEKMLKILGNDEWRYERTLEAWEECK